MILKSSLPLSYKYQQYMSIRNLTLHNFHEVQDFQLIRAVNICEIMVKMNYSSSKFLDIQKQPYLLLETHLVKDTSPQYISVDIFVKESIFSKYVKEIWSLFTVFLDFTRTMSAVFSVKHLGLLMTKYLFSFFFLLKYSSFCCLQRATQIF